MDQEKAAQVVVGLTFVLALGVVLLVVLLAVNIQ